MKFVFIGQVRSGKNSMQVDPRSGRHYSLPLFEKWRNEMVWRIKQQKGRPGILFPKPMILIFGVEYWPSDRRRRDMAGILDALGHVLEVAQIVQDDAQLKHSSGWIEHEVEKTNPRLEMQISENILTNPGLSS